MYVTQTHTFLTTRNSCRVSEATRACYVGSTGRTVATLLGRHDLLVRVAALSLFVVDAGVTVAARRSRSGGVRLLDSRRRHTGGVRLLGSRRRHTGGVRLLDSRRRHTGGARLLDSRRSSGRLLDSRWRRGLLLASGGLLGGLHLVEQLHHVLNGSAGYRDHRHTVDGDDDVATFVDDTRIHSDGRVL
jgi:hypothetical protein